MLWSIVLMVLLLAIASRALWRLGEMALLEPTAAPIVLSQVVFVLILTELYRVLIFYLREHRVSVALTLEVAIVSTLQEIMLQGGHEFDMRRVLGSSALLLVLGVLLAMERWFGRLRSDANETSSE